MLNETWPLIFHSLVNYTDRKISILKRIDVTVEVPVKVERGSKGSRSVGIRPELVQKPSRCRE